MNNLSAISIDTTSNGGSSNEFLTVETNEIKSDSIVFHEKLGSGQFGDVFRGTFKRNVTGISKKSFKYQLTNYNFFLILRQINI